MVLYTHKLLCKKKLRKKKKCFCLNKRNKTYLKQRKSNIQSKKRRNKRGHIFCVVNKPFFVCVCVCGVLAGKLLHNSFLIAPNVKESKSVIIALII
jgi:hypothetical protein